MNPVVSPDLLDKVAAVRPPLAGLLAYETTQLLSRVHPPTAFEVWSAVVADAIYMADAIKEVSADQALAAPRVLLAQGVDASSSKNGHHLGDVLVRELIQRAAMSGGQYVSSFASSTDQTHFIAILDGLLPILVQAGLRVDRPLAGSEEGWVEHLAYAGPARGWLAPAAAALVHAFWLTVRLPVRPSSDPLRHRL